MAAKGVLPKLLRVEDRAMDRTAAKWTEWAANKPSAAEMANFQESVATEAYETLKKEFADISQKCRRLVEPGDRPSASLTALRRRAYYSAL